MKAGFRWFGIWLLAVVFAAGCATGGRKGNAGGAAPVADAEWHSLVKSGRGCFLRNDFKGALPLFAAAAERSRALDDPQGLAVALLDESRCLEEMGFAAVLAGSEQAAGDGEVLPEASADHLRERVALAEELRAAMGDPRLGASRRGELAVARAEFDVGDDHAAAVEEAVPDPEMLPPAARARYYRWRAGRCGNAEEGRALLARIPEEAALPASLRAWCEILEADWAGTEGERLARLEAAAGILRAAGRGDGVAFVLALGGGEDIAGWRAEAATDADRVHAADMALRGASACRALGYGKLARQLLERAGAAGDPAIRERAETLRALMPEGAEDSGKGDDEP
jgi:hypothetical protein